jgi:hypothetical protein
MIGRYASKISTENDRGVCNKEKMAFAMSLVPFLYLLVEAVSSHTHPE